MIELTMSAHAKLNLTLDVLGKRADGYHDLSMVMQEITLGDTVTIQLETGKPWAVFCDAVEIPCDDSNLAVKAARLFFDAANMDCGGYAVTLQKRTPSCAGMGGGSADGAAVLRLLYDHYGAPFPEEELYRLAEQTGADVPFALFGGTALAEEKGQILHRLPNMPACTIVLCKPPFPVSTPELFREIDRQEIRVRPDTAGMIRALEESRLDQVAQRLCNVFTPVISEKHPELNKIGAVLKANGALGVSMTGSGPTMFGIFTDSAAAQKAYSILKQKYIDTFLTEPV